MAESVSGNRLSKILGVSERAVRNAAKAKRINRLPNGMFDPDEARQQWSETTDPARSRVRTTPRTSPMVRTEGPNPGETVRTPEDAREAVSLIARLLQEEGHPDDGKGITFDKARIAETILKTRQRDHDLKKQRREVYDAVGTGRIFQEQAMKDRDAWRAWPARVAILMADELRVDPVTGKVDYRILTSVLAKYVHEHQTEMGEPDEPEWPSAR